MSKKTILIVDDNALNREVYTAVLEYFGYRVLMAVDGQGALMKARNLLPDAILMDINMPVLDGIEATRRLKSDATTRHIPVITMTARDEASVKHRALRAGASAYLVKPTPPQLIVEEVRRCLRRSRRSGVRSPKGGAEKQAVREPGSSAAADPILKPDTG